MQNQEIEGSVVFEVSRQVTPLLIHEMVSLNNISISITDTGERLDYDANLEGELIQVAVSAAIGSAVGVTTTELLKAIPKIVRSIIERGGTVRSIVRDGRKISLSGKSGEEAEEMLSEDIDE